MKKVLIIIVVILALVESYLLLNPSTQPEQNNPLPLPLPTETIPAQTTVNRSDSVSYPDIYQAEEVDESWAKATEVQIYGTVKTLAAKYPSHFNNFSVACKTSICKVEVSTESSNQPFPILVAEFIYAMKKQGWQSDIATMNEELIAKSTSGNATIFLVNPTR